MVFERGAEYLPLNCGPHEGHPQYPDTFKPDIVPIPDNMKMLHVILVLHTYKLKIKSDTWYSITLI